MFPVHRERYPAAFAFLSQDLPSLPSTRPDVWRAFLRNSHLSEVDAKRAVTMDGSPPLVFASNLGESVFGLFSRDVPGRIEIGTGMLEHFEGDAQRDDAREFLRAKTLHEMCHWGCFRGQLPDNDEAGEAFEGELFGRELSAWWKGPAVSQAVKPFTSSVFDDARARADLLRKLLFGRDKAPGRADDPSHLVFAAADAAEAMPRGFRNNNPGNVRVGKSIWNGLADPADMTSFQRAEQSFCVFREPEWGLRVIAYLLRKYKRDVGADTPRKVISRWAPASDNNNVDSYSGQLAKALGVARDSIVDADDETTLITMMTAIARHENGDKPPYAPMQFQTAVLLL